MYKAKQKTEYLQTVDYVTEAVFVVEELELALFPFHLQTGRYWPMELLLNQLFPEKETHNSYEPTPLLLPVSEG